MLLWRRGHARGSTSGAGEQIVLGGRAFRRLAPLSVAADEEFLRLALTAGIQEPDPKPGEALGDYSERIVRRLLKTKTLRPLLACTIVPVGDGKWTPALATETAAFLGELDEPRDKERLWTLVAELLVPFFSRAVSSWRASLPSGEPTPAPPRSAFGSSPAHATTGAGEG